ncbi:hypothetical protein D9615_009162 [Tricholomella constricta]|uniref:Uncharacterized protein n=1 Tax=Tricholomella constricta TaxID=117010 RepID=A0A8H5LZW6_9AGAR|nr:hypothetical protein D9615_009162 [Tricholomella constricta]
MSPSTLALIARAVPELGGPTIEISDIEWASHIPASQTLLQWLVDQCVAPELDTHDEPTDRFLEQELGAALRAVALERDEMKILDYADASIAGDHVPDTIHAPQAYAPPSHLRKYATHLDAEARLLDSESAMLRSRLRQTKQASQRTAKTISSLQAAIEREDLAIARIQERLAELSVLADTTLSSGAQSAVALIDKLAPPLETEQPPDQSTSQNPHPSLVSPTLSLTRLANLRATLTEQHISRVSQLAPSAPKELLDDAASLSRKLDDLLCPGGRETREGKMREAAYTIELRRIYEALSSDETCLALEENADEGGEELSVQKLLEHAWALDQAAALDAERAVLDTTLKAHKETLLPELQTLHASLSERERAMRAAEAWVGTFVMEVEGVGITEFDTAGGVAAEPEPGRVDGMELEQLKSLLLEHHRKHRGVDDEPLVLLDKSDILAELQRIRKAMEEEGTGDGWREVVLLREKLGSLDASQHPLLDVLYGTSAVQTNASPPFGRSESVEQVERRAREAVRKLEAGVGQGEELEKILDGKRTQRKLGEFVQRWAKKSESGS